MRRREQIFDTRGRCVAQLSMAPPLYVMRTISAQKRHRPLSLSERRSALHHAADIFVNDELAGIAFDDYIRLTSRVSGLPISLTRDQILGVARDLSSVFEGMWPARPTGAALDWRAERTRSGSAVWVRRGETFAVLASGNAPGVHGLWLQALALGYRVIVRPSRREPFTGHRLVNALRKAGFRCDDIAYLPTDYVGADEIIRSADLSMVYGGQDVVDKYARNSNVFTNGPGRSKILITAEQDWRDYLDVIVDSIAGLGGMACVEHHRSALRRQPRASGPGHRRPTSPNRAVTSRRRAGSPPRATAGCCPPPCRTPRAGGRRHRAHLGRRSSGGLPWQWRSRAAAGRSRRSRSRSRQTEYRTRVPMCVGGAMVTREWICAPAQFAGAQRNHHRRGSARRPVGRTHDHQPLQRASSHSLQASARSARRLPGRLPHAQQGMHS